MHRLISVRVEAPEGFFGAASCPGQSSSEDILLQVSSTRIHRGVRVRVCIQIVSDERT
jgi:hypothetical protein